MTAVPDWLIGKHVTSVAITPLAASATAGALVLTPGTAASLFGWADEISLDYSAETEEINSMDRTKRNPVIVTKGTQFTVKEILRASGANILAAQASEADYFRFAFTRGQQSWTADCLATRYGEDLVRGKSAATMTMETVDNDTANPVYS